MRLHAALHVMSCVVVAPSGGNIAPDKARLISTSMSLLDAEKIERETKRIDRAWHHHGDGVIATKSLTRGPSWSRRWA
jgi:hypothetical protein